MNNGRIILGIDPGLKNTGWGIIKGLKMKDEHISNGVITTNEKQSMGDRLNRIFNDLNEICNEFKPSLMAVEKIFVNINPESSLKLGQARGISFLTASIQKIPVKEYSANQIKKSIVGYGHASKKQIMKMLNQLYPQISFVNEDSADAIAVAICHSMHSSSKVNS